MSLKPPVLQTPRRLTCAQRQPNTGVREKGSYNPETFSSPATLLAETGAARRAAAQVARCRPALAVALAASHPPCPWCRAVWARRAGTFCDE